MRSIAKLSYILALASIALLLLWSVGLITIVTFELKVFEKQSSEFLAMAILPILATVAGAGIINIISNVGIIANYITKQQERTTRFSVKNIFYSYIVLAALLIVGLFVGNSISNRIKEKELKIEMESVIRSNNTVISAINSTALEPDVVIGFADLMKFIDLQNKKLANPEIIFPCNYKNMDTFCVITDNYVQKTFKKKVKESSPDSVITLDSLNYIWRANENEKSLISEMFKRKDTGAVEIQLDENGKYVLFQYIKNGNVDFIFKMEKKERYGRLSS